MTVLITGSRGKVATTLIPLLRERGIAVRAASASPDKLTLPDGVERVVLDLDDPATFPAALAGVESVFLYANPKHIEAFLAEAKAAGVQHVALLSSSSVLDTDADTNAIAAMHLAVERGLRTFRHPVDLPAARRLRGQRARLGLGGQVVRHRGPPLPRDADQPHPRGRHR